MTSSKGKIITIGKTFDTIQEAMRCFGQETGKGRKACFYRFDDPGIAIWFPRSPQLNKDRLLVPERKQQWLNLLSKDETEISEVCLSPSLEGINKNRNTLYNRRAVFMYCDCKDGKRKYIFKGVFIRIAGSADGRSRFYQRIAKNINTALFTNVIKESNDDYGEAEE
ncbi:MAG: hypothetical protein FWG89_05850 [Treponema sp.]|nr:hypothetical protein [Treponema sp.]